MVVWESTSCGSQRDILAPLRHRFAFQPSALSHPPPPSSSDIPARRRDHSFCAPCLLVRAVTNRLRPSSKLVHADGLASVGSAEDYFNATTGPWNRRSARVASSRREAGSAWHWGWWDTSSSSTSTNSKPSRCRRDPAPNGSLDSSETRSIYLPWPSFFDVRVSLCHSRVSTTIGFRATPRSDDSRFCSFLMSATAV
jgi:hypothetical protein